MNGVDPYRPASQPGWQPDPPPPSPSPSPSPSPYGPPPVPPYGPASPYGAGSAGQLGRRPGRGPRARLVVAAMLALPLLELTGMVLVARALGVLALLALLIAGAVAGTLVLRRVRETAVRRFDPHRSVLGPGKVPGLVPGAGDGAPAQTVLLALAGVLLILPGFLSDAVGLVLLAPPVRRTVSAMLGEALLRRLTVRTARIVPGEVIVDGGGTTGPGTGA